MFHAARRGPASVLRSLNLSASNRVCHPSLATQILYQYERRAIECAFTRPLSLAACRKQQSLACAVEPEIEEQINSQQPPSNKQIDEATQHGPVTKFQGLQDRRMVCDTLVKTITQDMGLETMTQVQSMTINETLKGIDVLAQARTGTGKTLAFLIPVLQNIIKKDTSLEARSRGRRYAPIDIRAIIISPTRELAEQIAVEATKLTRNTGVIVQTAVGGTAKQYHLRMMKEQGCHVLVGTPGRLNDLLSDPRSQVRAPNLSAFVLDEADRLLDQGFAPEIRNIEQLLPNRNDIDRQTLLFSATVPDEVMQIVHQTMKRDFKFVRTVQKGEQQTHEKVPQKQVAVRGFANYLPTLLELCKREIANQDPRMPFKAIVYFGATAEVALAAQTFQNLKTPGGSIFHKHPLHPAKIIEINAKLSQQARTRAAGTFRRADSAILFSSDVTARGMDFPNVTHVIQMGIPGSKETYVHRIGRTGRGDKPGQGWLILTDFEAQEARYRLPKLPLVGDKSLGAAQVDMSQDAQLPEHVATTLTQIVDASRTVHREVKGAAYMANLGLYSWIPHKQDLVDSLNDRARYCWAMEEPPGISRGLIDKLGLSRVRGLVIGSRPPDQRDSREGSIFGRDRFSDSRRDGSSGFQRDRSSGYPTGYERSRGSSGRGTFQGGYQRSENRSYDRFDRNDRRTGYDRNSSFEPRGRDHDNRDFGRREGGF